MALGNNLKRIKKDSLIPSKKEKVKKSKPKKKVTSKAKSKEKATPAAVVKESKKIAKPKVKAVKPASKKATKPTPKAKAEKIVSTQKTSKVVVEAKAKEVANLDEKIILGGGENDAITAKLIPSRRKTVRKSKLIFEGSLSLIEADEIKKCLISTFTDYDIIDIQLQNITHLDIIPVQLINLFIDFYKDKKVKVDSDLPFDMKIVVERAGFGSLMFKEEAA